MSDQGPLVRSERAPEASRSESFPEKGQQAGTEEGGSPSLGASAVRVNQAQAKAQRAREGLIHPWPAMMRPEDGAKMHPLV